MAALISLAVLPTAFAAGETGTITGRVFNAESNSYLNNARVAVAGTTIEAYTDDAGRYELRNVPAGQVNLTVTYYGQKPLTDPVEVQPNGAAQHNFTFNAAEGTADKDGVITLDPFIVQARKFRTAQELAVNEEQTSTNIKSVVALNTLGYMPDGNIGDFVRFLPGVDVENGSTTGNSNNPDNAMTVAVRGFGPDSTAVLIDGMPIASGSAAGNGSLTRAVMLDSISINSASRLEIIKVATPDMPQNSPGGAINLITRGAFELPKAQYDLSIAFNGNSNNPPPLKRTPGPYGANFKTLPSVRLGVSLPLSKKLGVSFSVASDNKYSLTRNSNMRDWFLTNRTVTINGVVTQVANAKGGIRIDNPVMDRMELNDNQWLEKRLSGNLRIDWRPTDSLEFRANGQLSTFNNTGTTRRIQFRYSNAAGILDWGDTYITGRQRTSTFNPGYSVGMTTDARDKEGNTSSGYITAKYRKGPWSIDAKMSASESYNELPDLKNGHFSTIDASLSAGRIDMVDMYEGVVGRINIWDANGNPVDYGRLRSWNSFLSTGNVVRSSQVKSRDLQKQFNLDVSRELDFLPFPLTVKAGGQQNIKSTRKWGAGTGYRLAFIGPTTGVPNNAAFESDFAIEAKYGYATPQYWADPSKIYQFYTEHPDYFSDSYINPADGTNIMANNYTSRVGTTKALTTTNTDMYAMATAKLFHNRLTIIAGGRRSKAENEGTNVFNDPRYQFLRLPDGSLYRDSVYVTGVRYDGANNVGGPRDAILTDAALRGRLQAAGVTIPTALALHPNGTSNGTAANNLELAMRQRYTRYVDTSLTQPVTPQVQMSYEIRDDLRIQVAWSKETRLPDIEGANGIIVGGSSFQVNENTTPTTDPGGDGTITIANVRGVPEVNQSYNFKLSYFPKNSGGRYSISYYYKVVDNSWQTDTSFNTESDYDTLLGSMGFSREDFPNYAINTVTATGIKQVRKGFEIEVVQNFGVLAPWARGIDLFATYTRRPETARTGGETRLGWIPLLPVRAKWTGGISYSARRYSVQARWTFVESGINYSGSGTNVTMPDGTTRSVQYYTLNKVPPEVNLQGNYIINKNLTLFATANRVLTGKVYGQISDAQTGYQPEYASYRTVQDRGIALAVGLEAKF